MRNLDHIVVLRFLGTQSLGYYGLSVNVLTLLMAIPDSLVYVSYPQFVRVYSEAGQKAEVLHQRVERLARGIAIAPIVPANAITTPTSPFSTKAMKSAPGSKKTCPAISSSSAVIGIGSITRFILRPA